MVAIRALGGTPGGVFNLDFAAILQSEKVYFPRSAYRGFTVENLL